MSALRAERRCPRVGICQLIAGAMLAGAGGVGHAAEAITDYLTRSWYVTEVIVVQRAAVEEVNSQERLIVPNPPPLPYRMRTLFQDPDQIGAGYDLDAPTLAMLADVPAARPALLPELPVSEPEEPAEAAAADEEANVSAAELPPDPMQEFRALLANYETQLEEQSYRWLPASEFLMARDAAILRRAGMQVLLHGRWLQPVPGRDQPEPIFIQAGAKLAERYQLEGVLAVTLGRYLHFRAQLSYRDAESGERPMGLPVGTTEPLQNAPLPALAAGVMVLDESRRMRSEEVHYLDHPKLGILVRIDPVTLPDDLVADFQALQEPIE